MGKLGYHVYGRPEFKTQKFIKEAGLFEVKSTSFSSERLPVKGLIDF